MHSYGACWALVPQTISPGILNLQKGRVVFVLQENSQFSLVNVRFCAKTNTMVIKIWQIISGLIEINAFPESSEALNFKISQGSMLPDLCIDNQTLPTIPKYVPRTQPKRALSIIYLTAKNKYRYIWRHNRGSQWGGGFYSYRLKFRLFYGYRLIFFRLRLTKS